METHSTIIDRSGGKKRAAEADLDKLSWDTLDIQKAFDSATITDLIVSGMDGLSVRTVLS